MIADLIQKAAGFDKRRLYTAFSALVIAAAAGYFMQRGADVPGQDLPVVTAATVPSAAEETPEVATKAETQTPLPAQMTPEGAAGPVIETAIVMAEAPAAILADPIAGEPAETLSAAVPAPSTPQSDPALVTEPEAPVRLAALDGVGDLAQEPSPPSAADLAAACTIRMEAMPMPGALVALSIEAPCKSGEEVDFDHSGLRFSEQLDPDGSLGLFMPAMAEQAIVTARFEDGQEQATEVMVPDFGDYERVALVWKGATGLQLHALENGAFYGEPGHIWAQEPATSDRAIAGVGGFVSVLGSTADGFAADVYTFPAGLMVSGATPEVSIEAQVMENTCDGKIAGSFLRSNPGRRPTVSDLSMAVPGCDAVGGYLVLKNLPQDLKLARN